MRPPTVLTLTAYFILLDAYVVGKTATHSGTTLSRLLPVLALALPAAFALRFVGRLPTHLRPYLLRLAFAGKLRLATGCEVIAVALMFATAVAPQANRPSMSELAVLFAFIARLVLWYERRRVRHSQQTLA
jgi:hypothetical protein